MGEIEGEREGEGDIVRRDNTLQHKAKLQQVITK